MSTLVVDGEQKIPFLRGMLTHSLVERGLTFKEAYEAANLVRERIKKRREITKPQLREVINSVLAEGWDKTGWERMRRIAPVPTITVRGEEEHPFSKGILSQSLQASGLEPQNAYSIAKQLQLDLLEDDQNEISRDELRKLIYRRILEKHGPEYAERYLLWRYFKNPDKPLAILFGGATGVGKTSVATEMAHRLGIGKILSTDTVRQMMRMMFAHELLPAIHTSSFEAWKELSPDQANPKSVVTGFHEQSIRVLVGVRAMLERAIQENTNLVVEGVHLVPGLMRLEEFENRAYVIPVVLSTLNRENYLKRFPSRQERAGNRPAERYRRNFEAILSIQDYILEMAERYDTPIVENINLDETVSSILTTVTNSLREKLKITGEELVAKAL